MIGQRNRVSRESENRIKAAMNRPCGAISPTGAVEAKEMGLIEPVLVGPAATAKRIRFMGRSTLAVGMSRR
jgi:hypothetical protein